MQRSHLSALHFCEVDRADGLALPRKEPLPSDLVWTVDAGERVSVGLACGEDLNKISK